MVIATRCIARVSRSIAVRGGREEVPKGHVGSEVDSVVRVSTSGFIRLCDFHALASP